jgi:hypothetical protein
VPIAPQPGQHHGDAGREKAHGGQQHGEAETPRNDGTSAAKTLAGAGTGASSPAKAGAAPHATPSDGRLPARSRSRGPPPG